MAHELDRSIASTVAGSTKGQRANVANFFEVGTLRTAWHAEGHLVPPDSEFDRLKAMQLCNMDYDVEKRATYWQRRDPSTGKPEVAESALAFLTVRTDTEQELGRVGPDYTPVPNRDAFAAIDPLLQSGMMALETGGVLRNGADAWLLARYKLDALGPMTQELFAQLGVLPYALITANHSGRRNMYVAETGVRVVCANTLAFAEHAIDNAGASSEKAVAVSHRGDAKTKMYEAAERMFGDSIRRFEVIAQGYATLRDTHLTEAQFERLVLDVVAPDPRKNPQFNPEASAASMVIERADRKRAEVKRLWSEGAGHTGDASAWEAYNGVVQAIDHDRNLWPTRKGAWRTQSLMDGTLRRIKDDCFRVLYDFAENGEVSRRIELITDDAAARQRGGGGDAGRVDIMTLLQSAAERT